MRVLAGQRPESIGVQPTAENAYEFDWRQLQRWHIHEANLPAGSIVRFKVPTVWEAYKWHWIALDLGLPIAGFDDRGIDRATGSPGRAPNASGTKQNLS